MVVPLIFAVMFFVIIPLAFLFPGIIKVWQISFFTDVDTGDPVVWGVVGVILFLLLLRRNKQQNRVVVA